MPAKVVSLADLLEQLGDIAPRRVRAVPPPGTATEQDLLDIRARERRLYELVDGVLVEKVMGFPESTLACDLIKLLGNFLDENPVGFLAGMDGAVRLMPGLVRIPDVSFIAWEQLPTRERPTEPIPDLAPALAVEVLSEGNTPKEMARKVKEYFLSGVRVVWFVDLRRRAVRVYTAPDESVLYREGQALPGGAVLPGLTIAVEQVFAGLPRPGRGKRPRRKNGKA
jgi:Uma2 family endonuclease